MKQSLPCLLFLFVVVLLPAKAFSQQPKPADEALRQKAYTALESLAEEIGSLRSGENRARLGSNIAMSLWPHNKAKARQLFDTVTKEIQAGLARDDDDLNRSLAKPNFVKLREDTALRIGMFDPEWAMQFLEGTKPVDVYIRDEDRYALNLRLAIVFAGNNPDLALKLGRESVQHAVVSPAQLELIYVLNKKSRDHASALFAEMVKVAPYRAIRSTMKYEQFYISLARLVEPGLGRDPAFRDLMNYFTDLALEAGCGKKNYVDNDGFCYRLGLVVPFMEKVDPKRAAPLQHLGRKAAWPYEWSPELSQYGDAYENGTVEDLLAIIPKFPEFREAGQIFVIRKVFESGDFERARKLTKEFPWEDPSAKTFIEKLIADAEHIVNEDTSAEILRVASISNDEEAFNNLFRNATEIGAKNPQATLKLLDRASELWDKVPPDRRQMQYQIGLAARYCQIKSDRCFTMMEPVIRKLNELVSAATTLNGYDNRYLRNGEWNMTAEGGVGSLLTMLAQNAVYFALCDFDRAMAMTSQFERREIRMMAQLKLAQAVFDGPPKKPLFANNDEY